MFVLLVLGGITVVGEMVLIPIAMSERVSANNAFTALMLAIMLPYCIMVCLVALFSAIASVHEKFTAQSVSPIILNLVTAGAAVLPVLLFSSGYPIRKRVVWVAVAVLIAGDAAVVADDADVAAVGFGRGRAWSSGRRGLGMCCVRCCR